jgi:hypothetical protein
MTEIRTVKVASDAAWPAVLCPAGVPDRTANELVTVALAGLSIVDDHDTSWTRTPVRCQ